MKVLKKIGSVYLAQFDCHLRPFVLRIDLDNETDPTIASLLFEEANEAGVILPDPIRFTLKLQPDTWQEIEPDDIRNRQDQTLIQEYFLDQSKAVIRLILGRIKAARYDEDTCLSAFKMPRQDIRKGMLVSYTEVMNYGDDDSPLWFGYDLVYGTRRYLVDDRYCPNPQCDCQTVFFDFHQVSSETTEPICLLLVGFDGQRVEIQKCHQGSQSHARALLNQLLAQESDLLVECKRRYKRIRQATTRICDTQPLIPKALLEPKASARSKIVSIPPQRPSTRIGRNSPCPCGSGRKYKQCCGGRMTVDG